jgi:hypothetical protein
MSLVPDKKEGAYSWLFDQVEMPFPGFLPLNQDFDPSFKSITPKK